MQSQFFHPNEEMCKITSDLAGGLFKKWVDDDSVTFFESILMVQVENWIWDQISSNLATSEKNPFLSGTKIYFKQEKSIWWPKIFFWIFFI